MKYTLSIQPSAEPLRNPNLDEDLRWWALEGHEEGYGLYLEDGGKILAKSSLLFRRFILGDNTFRIAHFGHHFVDPSIRQQGIFKNILLKSKEICTTAKIDGIFVTPNAASEPIYRSQGYDCMDALQSHLYVINLDASITNSSTINVTSLSLEEYFDQTKGFDRFHQLDHSSFLWRFSRPKTEYNFANFIYNDDVVHLAFRLGGKGPIETYVLSEVFMNGVKPPLAQITEIIQNYFSKIQDMTISKVIVQSFDSVNIQGVEMYRRFPFVLQLLNSDASFIVTHLNQYQFTDSDYG